MPGHAGNGFRTTVVDVMDTALWLVRIAVFWLMTVPLLTLLHELGHALAGLLTTSGTVTWSSSGRFVGDVHRA